MHQSDYFLQQSLEKYQSPIGSLLLLPLRLIRNSIPQSPFVLGLEALNDDLLPEIERIMEKNEATRDTLIDVLIGVSYFSASILENEKNESNKGGSVFTRRLYEKIAKVSDEIKKQLPDKTQTWALDKAVKSLELLVGKNAKQVYAILHDDHTST